ncbi:MAG: helix-turn-helix transcriptional regulator [Bacteroidota bacterium]
MAIDKDELKAIELNKLAERIRSLRIQRGYSNYENFAYEHKIPRAQYGRYEKGEDLRYSSLVKIVKAFDMTMTEFFSEGFD